ncbi:hypothetical protein [Breoghania sp.]|uniref:hypothetical protein n=1 Tax=Breoghania sp. TaxID=2065378 RepID=UPI002601B3A2|nr:hypothetical protein [Breoghania sp.]MDJ0930618.1 hypothetical protein [Breoghania sp.]
MSTTATATVVADRSQAVSSMLASFMKQGAQQAQAMAAMLEEAAQPAKATAPSGMGARVDVQA